MVPPLLVDPLAGVLLGGADGEDDVPEPAVPVPDADPGLVPVPRPPVLGVVVVLLPPGLTGAPPPWPLNLAAKHFVTSGTSSVPDESRDST